MKKVSRVFGPAFFEPLTTKPLVFSRSQRHQLIRNLAGFVVMASLLSCGTVRVYQEPDQPMFHSHEEAQQTSEQTDSLSVVTFNIRKAEKVDLAIDELQELQKTKPVDVYLLQEMDEKGVEEIATSLGLNYLYIPAVYNTSLKKDIGNAILTKGTIECPEKLLLPHAKPLSKSRRLATIAEVTILNKKILVYSVHTETVVMSRKNRMDQVSAIIKHAKQQQAGYKYVLIGGDFNTLLSRDGDLAIEKFNQNGFHWSTADVGTTARGFLGLVKPRHDYIFSKGLKLLNTSKIETSKSSDHYPVLATFGY